MTINKYSTYTDKGLKERYDKYNRKYFGNQLPKETKVTWMGRKGHVGDFVVLSSGAIVILINPLLRKLKTEKYALLTLLHEMCHLSLWCQRSRASHGPKFQAEMKRLASLGAFETIW